MNKTNQKNWEWEVSRIACQNIAQKVLALDVSDVCISDELQSRAEELFEKERIVARKRSIRRRVAAILIAAALLALTACMSIPTVREKLYKIVITYYDEFFSYKSEPIETDEATKPVTETDAGCVTDTQGVVTTEPIETAFERRLPAYLPKGFDAIKDSSTSALICIDYGNFLDNTMICYEQSLIGTTTYKINSEYAQIQEVLINGNEGIVARKVTDDHVLITLVWNDGIYDYRIDTTLTLDETIKLAESVD
jgi:hypothetical protein